MELDLLWRQGGGACQWRPWERAAVPAVLGPTAPTDPTDPSLRIPGPTFLERPSRHSTANVVTATTIDSAGVVIGRTLDLHSSDQRPFMVTAPCSTTIPCSTTASCSTAPCSTAPCSTPVPFPGLPCGVPPGVVTPVTPSVTSTSLDFVDLSVKVPGQTFPKVLGQSVPSEAADQPTSMRHYYKPHSTNNPGLPSVATFHQPASMAVPPGPEPSSDPHDLPARHCLPPVDWFLRPFDSEDSDSGGSGGGDPPRRPTVTNAQRRLAVAKRVSANRRALTAARRVPKTVACQTEASYCTTMTTTTSTNALPQVSTIPPQSHAPTACVLPYKTSLVPPPQQIPTLETLPVSPPGSQGSSKKGTISAVAMTTHPNHRSSKYDCTWVPTAIHPSDVSDAMTSCYRDQSQLGAETSRSDVDAAASDCVLLESKGGESRGERGDGIRRGRRRVKRRRRAEGLGVDAVDGSCLGKPTSHGIFNNNKNIDPPEVHPCTHMNSYGGSVTENVSNTILNLNSFKISNVSRRECHSPSSSDENNNNNSTSSCTWDSHPHNISTSSCSTISATSDSINNSYVQNNNNNNNNCTNNNNNNSNNNNSSNSLCREPGCQVLHDAYSKEHGLQPQKEILISGNLGVPSSWDNNSNNNNNNNNNNNPSYPTFSQPADAYNPHFLAQQFPRGHFAPEPSHEKPYEAMSHQSVPYDVKPGPSGRMPPGPVGGREDNNYNFPALFYPPPPPPPPGFQYANHFDYAGIPFIPWYDNMAPSLTPYHMTYPPPPPPGSFPPHQMAPPPGCPPAWQWGPVSCPPVDLGYPSAVEGPLMSMVMNQVPVCLPSLPTNATKGAALKPKRAARTRAPKRPANTDCPQSKPKRKRSQPKCS